MITDAFVRTDRGALDDLDRRLRAFRGVPGVGGPADSGIRPDWLLPLMGTWAEGYVWTAHGSGERPLPLRRALLHGRRLARVRDGWSFPAWERPDDYLWGIRRALEVARPPG